MIKNKESHSYIYDYTRTAIGAFTDVKFHKSY